MVALIYTNHRNVYKGQDEEDEDHDFYEREIRYNTNAKVVNWIRVIFKINIWYKFLYSFRVSGLARVLNWIASSYNN
jgi:hypothetical protein